MVTITPEGVALGAHVVAGVVALLAGLVALATEKGGDRHRLAGRTYVRSMAVVVATVPVLLAFDPTDPFRQFLLLVAVFSGYLVFSGYRVLSRKRPAAGADAVDWLAAGSVVAASVGLGVWGLALVVDGTGALGGSLGIVMVVFAGIGGALGVADLRGFGEPGRRAPWTADHLSRMIAGYIATVTAVSAVNATALLPGVVPGAVAWLWPTAVGVPLIWYWQSKYADAGPLADAGG